MKLATGCIAEAKGLFAGNHKHRLSGFQCGLSKQWRFNPKIERSGHQLGLKEYSPLILGKHQFCKQFQLVGIANFYFLYNHHVMSYRLSMYLCS